MRKIAIAAAACAVLAGAPAFAADLPEAIAETVAVPSFSWTGAYVGVNAGYGFAGGGALRAGPGTANAVAAFASGSSPSRFSLDPNGFLGGLQVGYNYQFDNSPFVIGVEADIQYSDIDDRITRRTSVVGFADNISRASTDMDWFGTVRARVGFTPVDRALVYVTGGLAYGDVDVRYSTAYPALGQLLRGKSSGTEVGWTVGGGLEYAVTDNWTVKGEYLYYDLGTVKFSTRNPVGIAAAARARADLDGHIVRIGLNYKF